jgi:hypothetical protein
MLGLRKASRDGPEHTSDVACLSREIRLARHVASEIHCAYLYVPGETDNTLQNNTLTKLHWQCNHVVRPSDGKVWIKFITSTFTMSYNV